MNSNKNVRKAHRRENWSPAPFSDRLGRELQFSPCPRLPSNSTAPILCQKKKARLSSWLRVVFWHFLQTPSTEWTPQRRAGEGQYSGNLSSHHLFSSPSPRERLFICPHLTWPRHVRRQDSNRPQVPIYDCLEWAGPHLAVWDPGLNLEGTTQDMVQQACQHPRAALHWLPVQRRCRFFLIHYSALTEEMGMFQSGLFFSFIFLTYSRTFLKSPRIFQVCTGTHTKLFPILF